MTIIDKKIRLVAIATSLTAMSAFAETACPHLNGTFTRADDPSDTLEMEYRYDGVGEILGVSGGPAVPMNGQRVQIGGASYIGKCENGRTASVQIHVDYENKDYLVEYSGSPAGFMVTYTNPVHSIVSKAYLKNRN